MNGALGCLSRLPIPQELFRLGPHRATAETSELSGEQPAEDSLSRWSKDLWNPYLRKTALRVFASCGLSAQVRIPINTYLLAFQDGTDAGGQGIRARCV